MKARAIALYLAVGALGALLLMPAGAAARPEPREQITPPSIDQTIFERGSNGFVLTVGVHDRRRLTISAQRLGRGLSFQTALYKMPVRLRPGSTQIKARIGKLGRIDMRFHPEKVREVAPERSHCKGGKIVEEEGFWVGLLAFHGEHGYTQVRVRSALGTVTKTPSLTCHRGSPPDPKKLKREVEALEKEKEEREETGEEEEAARTLKIEATARDRRISFLATRLATGKGRKSFSTTNLVAVGTRSRGRIKEVSDAIEVFAPGSYVRPIDSEDQLAEVMVKPRFPFSGSAFYRTHPHGPPTWSGDLAVELPGFGDVRLAGKGTHAAACESILTSCRGGAEGRASALLRDPLPLLRGRLPLLLRDAALGGAAGPR